MNSQSKIAGQQKAPDRCQFTTKDGRWTCRLQAGHAYGHKLARAVAYGKKA